MSGEGKPTSEAAPQLAPRFSYKGLRQRMRTMRGQLIMIGGAIVGGLFLAIVALAVRPWLFEPYIRQRFPELTAAQKATIERIESGEMQPSDFESLSVTAATRIYGSLINGELEDLQKTASRGLIEFHSEVVISNLKITVASGSHEQIGNALEIVSELEGRQPEELRTTLEFIQRRSARTGAQKILAQASNLISQLQFEGDNDE